MKILKYMNKENANKYLEVHDDGYGHSSVKQYMEWDTPRGHVKNLTGTGRLNRMSKEQLDTLLEDYEGVD